MPFIAEKRPPISGIWILDNLFLYICNIINPHAYILWALYNH